jgi:hypothetical protein
MVGYSDEQIKDPIDDFTGKRINILAPLFEKGHYELFQQIL